MKFLVDLSKSGRYIDIFHTKTCATTKISTVVGYHVVLATLFLVYGFGFKPVSCIITNLVTMVIKIHCECLLYCLNDTIGLLH